MKLSQKGKEFIKNEEGVRLRSYTATDNERERGIFTIGYGNTFYEDGSKVLEGDIITQERAESLFDNVSMKFENAVNDLVSSRLNQNQFDALTSLAFNIGIGALRSSTILKNVNRDPNNEVIRSNFEAWRFANKKPILLNRRKREADLYFS